MATVIPPFYLISQTFQLPPDYPRGTGGLVPPLTGFQLFVRIPAGLAATADVSWELDYRVNSNFNWLPLTSGTSTGAARDGKVWFNMFFTTPVDISTIWTKTFRMYLTASTNLTGIYYSLPNPLTTTGQATQGGGPIDQGSSLMFRVLAGIADSGTDFLGNGYRSMAVRSAIDNVSPTTPAGTLNYWLSKPNPSQFAIESLYFTMNNGPVVIDRLTVDPLTPGLYFHVYYSSDSLGPGVDNASWEKLLWTPVYKSFQAQRRTTYALPSPISAKYIKIEFSQLQPRSYTPGDFQKAAQYRKYPKWVLDYFLARFAAQENDFLSSGVNVTYDAIDLAYSYYTQDLLEAPALPAFSQSGPTAQVFQPQTTLNQVDAQTLARVNLALQAYSSPPAVHGQNKSVLAQYASSISATNYPTEVAQSAVGDTSVVSNLQREALLLEKGFPTMFFFLPCRHGYRLAQANFDHHIAYFAGINSIAFHRDQYNQVADQPQYNDIFVDSTNAARNDFLSF